MVISYPCILVMRISVKGGIIQKKSASQTEKESFFEKRIFNDHHYKTTITDGKDKAEGRGRTPEEAEKLASDRWNKKKEE